MPDRPYQPLADYGLVGDCHGAALVSRDGSVDWACLGRFDEPSFFGRILDRSAGGFWQIAPRDGYESSFRYVERTAVLETAHRTGGGAVRVRDCFLPPREDGVPHAHVRVCEGVAGEIDLVSVFEPRPGYGRDMPSLEPDGSGALRVAGERAALLVSTVGQAEREHAFTLATGERAAFALLWGEQEPRVGELEGLVEEAEGWWREWTHEISYAGPWEKPVVRSAITLKLLTYLPTGALVAAPTTSLPERIGGEWNWDYRYTWLRDASLTLYALLATGQQREGDPFFDWLCARVGESDVPSNGVPVVCAVDGKRGLEERALPHLDGYRGSRPVRVGNAASAQSQLDVYGELLDCFSTACFWGRGDKLSLWESYRPLADWVCLHWQEPDSGIWELRGEPRHYVYSKVMGWVALDRALRVAEREGLPGDLELWRRNRDGIRAAVLERGWSERLGAFTQSFEDERLDASNLLLPLVGFLAPDDPRALSSLERTAAELRDGALVHRFAPDGAEAPVEGAFTICSFWLVSALVLAGRTDEALELFEGALGHASPLGLLAEEVDATSGELLGNLPQAFAHAALLSAAVNLARGADVGEAPDSDHAPDGTAHLVPSRETVDGGGRIRTFEG